MYVNLKHRELQVIFSILIFLLNRVILEELYYGNLFPHEKCAKLDDEVKELLKLLNRNEEKFTATLTEAQKETFEKYKDCNREISEICEREAFLNGFRLGAQIIIESVNQ